MSASDGFDLSEFEKLKNELLTLATQKFPKETKAHMRTERNKFNKGVKAAYRSKVKGKTGILVKGVGGGAPYVYNNDEYQIRSKNTAPHAHLIENGHVLAKQPVLTSAGKQIYINPHEEKFVKGYHIISQEVKEFKNIFIKDTEKFIDDMLEEGLH